MRISADNPYPVAPLLAAHLQELQRPFAVEEKGSLCGPHRLQVGMQVQFPLAAATKQLQFFLLQVGFALATL